MFTTRSFVIVCAMIAVSYGTVSHDEADVLAEFFVAVKFANTTPVNVWRMHASNGPHKLFATTVPAG